MPKPIAVIIYEDDVGPYRFFDNINAAERYAERSGGTIYRRNDWYQLLLMLVEILIGRV